MSVEGCEFIAKSANGAVYRYDDETILKTYFAKDALPEIKQERENARKAFVLGINTAIPYGIVRVGDRYGTVTELLNAVSVTKLIKNNPEDMSEAVKYYIDMLKSIHAIEVEDGDKIQCGQMIFTVVALPGHTKWSVGFYIEQDELLLATETLGVFTGFEKIIPSYLVGYDLTLKSFEKIEKFFR